MDAARAQQVMLAKVLSCGQAEGQGLATAGQVARNHILSRVDGVERVLLDGEQVLDAPRDHLLGRSGLDLGETRKLTIGDDDLLHGLGACFFRVES